MQALQDYLTAAKELSQVETDIVDGIVIIKSSRHIDDFVVDDTTFWSPPDIQSGVRRYRSESGVLLTTIHFSLGGVLRNYLIDHSRPKRFLGSTPEHFGGISLDIYNPSGMSTIEDLFEPSPDALLASAEYEKNSEASLFLLKSPMRIRHGSKTLAFDFERLAVSYCEEQIPSQDIPQEIEGIFYSMMDDAEKVTIIRRKPEATDSFTAKKAISPEEYVILRTAILNPQELAGKEITVLGYLPPGRDM